MPNDATLERDYRATRGRIRMAILACIKLTAAERVVAVAMLEHVNREAFIRDGILRCWPSEATLAHLTGFSGGCVRKARRTLCKIGAAEVVRLGGHGPRDTSCYAFHLSWAARATADAEARTVGAPNSLRGNCHDPSPQCSAPPSEPGRGHVENRKGSLTEQIRGHAHDPETLDSKLMRKTCDARSLASADALAHARVKQEKKDALQWEDVVKRVHRVGILPADTVSGILIAHSTVSESSELGDPATSYERVAEIVEAIKRRATYPPFEGGTAGVCR